MLSQVGIGGTYHEIRVAERCFVQLLSIRSAAKGGALPTDVPLFYDVRKAGGGGVAAPPEKATRWGLGEDVPLQSVVLRSSEPLPSLVIPSVRPGRSLNMMVSSCRKPHGRRADAVDVALARLEASWSGGWRPHCGLMMGDQIYADDVSSATHQLVQELARVTFGEAEVDPSMLSGKELAALSPNERAELLRKAGLTSDEREYHCIDLGEFVSMYLLTFAGSELASVCTKLLEEMEKLARERIGVVDPFARVHRDEADARGDLDAIVSTRRWLESAASLRILMANMATYFLLDDHEVSDDWNLRAEWAPGLDKYRLRDRVLCPNALTAYFLFQAWGNDPESPQWESKALSKHNRPVGKSATSLFRPTPGALSDWTWSFSLVSSPVVSFLDTRSRRDLRAGVPRVRRRKTLQEQRSGIGDPLNPWSLDGVTGATGTALICPSDAMGPSELDWLLAVVAERGRNIPVGVIVTPTPVFGNSRLEGLQRTGAKSLDGADVEGWLSHPKSIWRFAKALATSPVRRVAVLSGDIHAGYICSGALTIRAGRSLAAVRIAFCQVVSSASRNGMSSLEASIVAATDLRLRPKPYYLWCKPTGDGPKEFDYCDSRDLRDAVVVETGLKPNLEIEFDDGAGNDELYSRLVFDNNWGEVSIDRYQCRVRLHAHGQEAPEWRTWPTAG